MTDPLLAQFLVESHECLAEADKALLALEREPDAATHIDALFRALHTLKGGAGVFNFVPVIKLTHAAESALSQVRKQALELTPPLIEVLFETLDTLSLWLEKIEAGENLDSSAAERARELMQGYAPFLPTETVAPARKVEVDLAWTARLPEAAWQKPGAGMSDARMALIYTPDEGCFFSGDDPLAFMRGLPGLLALHMEMQRPLPDLDSIETYQCYLKFFALSDASPAELEAYCRASADHIALVAMQQTAPHSPALQPMFQQVIAAQLHILDLPQTASSKTRIAGLIQIVNNALTFTKNHAALTLLDAAATAATDDADLGPLRGFLQALLSAPSDAAPLDLAPNLEEENSDTATAQPVAKTKWIKVEQAKIDRLLELLGELTVANTGLLHQLDKSDIQKMIAQVQARHARMQRTLQDLQDVGLSIRMLPLAQVLQRLPRLTRDLAARMDKKVRLAIEGEDTEADKRVVENLAEPLLHIVRNSIGHGIESVADRLAAGKRAEGLISVRAFHRGEHSVIEIQDDGRGMDAQAIKQKALAQKLLVAEVADKLSPDALLQLVFLPGFSTAAEVSEVAGRGVGMDVVKSVVESVGGQVTIASRLGQSTTVTLSLPVDIAISKIMTVAVAGQLFGLPMAQVRHTLRSPKSALRNIKKKQAFAFREQILTLLYLRELLALPGSPADPAEVAIVVLETPQGLLGLAVDSFAEPNDVVVKPMAGILRGLTQYAGNALLSDGSILLILDMREVLSHAH